MSDPATDGEAGWLGGVHPVREALRGINRSVEEVWIRKDASSSAVDEVVEEARRREVPVRRVDRDSLDSLGLTHAQGVAVRCGPFRYRGEADLPAADRERVPDLVVVVDHVQDPQNLGAILRTAEVAGAAAACIPRARAASVTPAVVRASAGATEHLPIHRVANIARTLERLEENGYWTVGLDPQGAEPWSEVDYRGGVALVVGSEGEGLHRLVAERCDHRVVLPVLGRVESLNASAAFAAVAYEVVRQQTAGR